MFDFLGLKLKSPYFLAPLAGYTDYLFRKIIKEFNCGLSYTEMISATGLVRQNRLTKIMADIKSQERPIALQLFGNDEFDFKEAVRYLNDIPIDIIDINMGCPMPKIVKNKAGSYLMKEPQKVEKIVKNCVSVAQKPITIKIRSGWDCNNINALAIAKIAEEQGASAVCIHARTKTEAFSGKANLDIIAEVKANLKIPVIGNGDVYSIEDAKLMFDKTKCDFIMIGRGAINFFIPKELRKKKLLEHLKAYYNLYGEKRLIEMRKFVVLYTKGFKNASDIRNKANFAKSLADFENAINLL